MLSRSYPGQSTAMYGIEWSYDPSCEEVHIIGLIWFDCVRQNTKENKTIYIGGENNDFNLKYSIFIYVTVEYY